MRISKIKVKVLDENCSPYKAHKWDAGWDLKAAETHTVAPGQVIKVKTGVMFEIPPRHFGMVTPRSSSAKTGLVLANTVGIIDSDYRGEIICIIKNTSDEHKTINQYDRIAQIIIIPFNASELWVVDKLSNTERGAGGFGSTGKNNSTKTTVTKEAEKTKEEVATKEPEKQVDKKLEADAERQKKIEELKAMPKGKYMKLKNSGELFNKYPIATGDIKIDLGE